jgi:hypothetical protein
LTSDAAHKARKAHFSVLYGRVPPLFGLTDFRCQFDGRPRGVSPSRQSDAADQGELRSEAGPPGNVAVRVSVDPELIIRMLLTAYSLRMRPEQQLCEEVKPNLAYLWFCPLSITDRVPNHSTFSKNRQRCRDDDDDFGTGPEVREYKVCYQPTLLKNSVSDGEGKISADQRLQDKVHTGERSSLIDLAVWTRWQSSTRIP